MGADLFNQTPATPRSKLPPDPEELNDERAAWAQHCVIEFIGQTGVDDLDCAVGDLLADIMHLCDRIGVKFDEQLSNAKDHYAEEIETGVES